MNDQLTARQKCRKDTWRRYMDAVCIITRKSMACDPEDWEDGSIVECHGFAVANRLIVTNRHGLPKNDLTELGVEILFPEISHRVDVASHVESVKMFVHPDGIDLCLITLKSGHSLPTNGIWIDGPSFNHWFEVLKGQNASLGPPEIHDLWIAEVKDQEATALVYDQSEGCVVEKKGQIDDQGLFHPELDPGHSGCPILAEKTMVLAGAAFQIRDSATEFEIVQTVIEANKNQLISFLQMERLEKLDDAYGLLGFAPSIQHLNEKEKTKRNMIVTTSLWDLTKESPIKGLLIGNKKAQNRYKSQRIVSPIENKLLKICLEFLNFHKIKKDFREINNFTITKYGKLEVRFDYELSNKRFQLQLGEAIIASAAPYKIPQTDADFVKVVKDLLKDMKGRASMKLIAQFCEEQKNLWDEAQKEQNQGTGELDPNFTSQTPIRKGTTKDKHRRSEAYKKKEEADSS